MEYSPSGRFPRHHLLAALLEGRGPARHAVPEGGAGPGVEHGAGAVALAQGTVLHHLVLVGGDVLAGKPDGRPNGTVRVDGVRGPVAGRIAQVEPAGIGHGGDLEPELARQKPRHRRHGLEVAVASRQEVGTRLAAVGANDDFLGILRLVDLRADVPLHPHRLDAHEVLVLFQRNVRHLQHLAGVRETLLPGHLGERLPHCVHLRHLYLSYRAPTMKIACDVCDFHGIARRPGSCPPHSTPYSLAQLVQRIFSSDSVFKPGNEVKVETASGQRESM